MAVALSQPIPHLRRIHPAVSTAKAIWIRARKFFAWAVIIPAICAAIIRWGNLPTLDTHDPGAGIVAAFFTMVGLTFLIILGGAFIRTEGLDLRLPVRAGDLIGWRMLYGVVVVGVAYALYASLIWNPLGAKLSPSWPALAVGAAFAWTMAIYWLPIRQSYVAAFLCAVMPWAVIIPGAVAEAEGVSPAMVGLADLLLIGMAYPVATYGLSRKRMGALQAGAARKPAKARGAIPLFASVFDAQVSIGWRSHGLFLTKVWGLSLALSLPMLLADRWMPDIFPPSPLPILSSVRVSDWTHSLLILVAALPCLAYGLGSGLLFRLRPGTKPETTWLQTRPIHTTTIVAGQSWVAFRSALAAWATVVPAALVALALPAEDGNRQVPLAAALIHHATLHGIIVLSLAIALGVWLTWKGIVDSLWWELNPRAGGVHALLLVAGAFALMGFILVVPSALRDHILQQWPYAIAAAAGIKLALLGLVTSRLVRRHLATPAALVKIGIGWLAAVAGLFILCVCELPVGSAPAWLIASFIVLALPGVRLALAPIAFDMSRHQ